MDNPDAIRASPSGKRSELRKTFSIGGFRTSVANIDPLVKTKSKLSESSPGSPNSRATISYTGKEERNVSPSPPGRPSSNTQSTPNSPTVVKSRRATGFAKPLRVSQIPGASPLPIRLSLETPSVARTRSQQVNQMDILLRQKKVMN